MCPSILKVNDKKYVFHVKLESHIQLLNLICAYDNTYMEVYNNYNFFFNQ